MGCEHYETSANNAKKRKDKLITERKKYEDLQENIESQRLSLENYANFFTQLGKALEDVVVNNKSFDDGECAKTAGGIKTQINQMSNISINLATAIKEIEEEIEEEDKIINNRWKTCQTCAATEEVEAPIKKPVSGNGNIMNTVC